MPKTQKRQLSFDGWIAETLEALMRAKRQPADIETTRTGLIAQLPPYLKSKKGEVTKPRIFEELDTLFWKGRTKLIQDASKSGQLSAEKLYEILKLHHRGDEPMPPRWVVEAKFRDMHGRTSAPHKETETLRGILRLPIKTAKAITLAETSFEKPFRALSGHADNRFKIGLISAPQLGLPYDADIYRNLTRSGLSAARKSDCDAVVIGGGLFHLPLKKAGGPNGFLRALASGLKVDAKLIGSEYREEFKQITESDDLVPAFVTALERFESLLDGLHKVAVRPNGKPEFEGPIYIVASPTDFDVIVGAAYWEFGYEHRVRLLQAQAHARFTAKIAEDAYENVVEAEQEGSGVKAAKAAYAEAAQEARDAAAVESRIRVTNFDDEQNKKAIARAESYFVAEIEKHLPNAKVIGFNEAHLLFGKSTSVLHVISSGKQANPYYAELGNYGPTQRKGKLSAYTVVMHPQAVYSRATSRENYLDGKMLGTVGDAEAPMLVDKEPIMRSTQGHRIPSPTLKAIGDPMFQGGMLTLSVHPDLGMTTDFVSIETVRTLGAARRGHPAPPVKCVYEMIATDRHFGGSMGTTLVQPSGLPISLTDAVFLLMRRDGMTERGLAPIAGLSINDDILHGNHFGTHTRAHYNKRPYADVLSDAEKLFAELERIKDPAERETRLRSLTVEAVNQIRLRPPDFLTGQFEELFPFLRTNRDVFKGILLYAKHHNVVVRGVSELMGRQSDMRDVGLINLGSGNHFTKSTDGMLHEGPLVAEYIRTALRYDPSLAGQDLDRLIRAPLFQDQAIGYGTLQVDGRYTWGLHIAGTPPKRDSWRDTLHGWVAVNRQRGNPSSVLDRKCIVHTCGDKHFSARAFAGNDVYIMGSSATHTDGFAEIAGGLTENTSGVDFAGLPIDGPDSGEIRVVHLTPDVIQHFILHPEKKFPWDDLLINRA